MGSSTEATFLQRFLLPFVCVYVFVPAHFGGGLGLGVGMWRCVRASLGTLERASVLSAFVSHYGALPVACLHAKKKVLSPH